LELGASSACQTNQQIAIVGQAHSFGVVGSERQALIICRAEEVCANGRVAITVN
jgi:hypothetical protein